MTSHLKDVHVALRAAWPSMTRKERREWLKENVPDYYKPQETVDDRKSN